jgi:hypothetical protein
VASSRRISAPWPNFCDTQVPFGSDWPHPEGLARPANFVEDLSTTPEPSLRMIMGENMAQWMNVPTVAV